MTEFLELLPPTAALNTLLPHVKRLTETERVATQHGLNRVTAAPVTAPISLPPFGRATVDGYAVRAADTHGAAESLPAYLTLAGEVLMGETPRFTIEKGECALIHTGGMLPTGTDSVVMIEQTEHTQIDIEIRKAVGMGDGTLRAGEDVQTGDVVIKQGARLRPAEIGGLMALGLDSVGVVRRPRIAILSSGDELIPPGQPIQSGQIYDVNSYTLNALITQAGGEPIIYPIIPDEETAFRDAANRALAESDMVLFTAGSSVSVRDLTAQTIDGMGRPGVLVHGVNVRPGKPTILAMCDGKPVIGLPGNPVSAFVIARLFCVPVIERLLGVRDERPRPSVSARLTVNVPSQSGREDWLSVRLVQTDEGVAAEPLFGKSNLIFTLAKGDGLLKIPATANGVAAGSSIVIELL